MMTDFELYMKKGSHVIVTDRELVFTNAINIKQVFCWNHLRRDLCHRLSKSAKQATSDDMSEYGYNLVQLMQCESIEAFISKFQIGLKCLLHQGLWEPEFYGDLVYKLKKIVGSNNFSAQFIKIISNYKKITLMYCNRLHAWWSTRLKDLSIDEMVGA